MSQNKYAQSDGEREAEKSLDEQNDGRKVSPSTFSSIPNPNNPLILFLISIRGLSLPHTHTHMHQCYSALQYALLRYTVNFMFSSPSLSPMKPIWFYTLSGSIETLVCWCMCVFVSMLIVLDSRADSHTSTHINSCTSTCTLFKTYFHFNFEYGCTTVSVQ